jgi:hypothetical protein
LITGSTPDGEDFQYAAGSKPGYAAPRDDPGVQRQHAAKGGQNVERLIAEACKKHKVSLSELRSASRPGKMPELRRRGWRRN